MSDTLFFRAVMFGMVFGLTSGSLFAVGIMMSIRDKKRKAASVSKRNSGAWDKHHSYYNTERTARQTKQNWNFML